MRLNELVVPKENEKVFKITDFEEITDFCLNVTCGQTIELQKHKVEKLSQGFSTCVATYFANNRIFFYSSDKYIYEYKDYRNVKLDQCESQPILVPIIYEGKEEVLVVNSLKAFVLGKSEREFSIPKGSCFASYDNRIFIAQGTSIYFGGKFDSENMSMDLLNIGSINTFSYDGDILALVPYEDNLVVFCKKAVYVLNISKSNDFTFTRCVETQLDIKERTVAKVKDEIFFVSNKKFCSYKEGKIKVIDVVLEKYLSEGVLTASVYGEYYMLPFTMLNENYIFLFSVRTRKLHIINNIVGNFVGDKYLYETTTKRLHQITENMPITGEWTSTTLDFGSHKKKVITEIGITSTTRAELYVFSETGYRYFSIEGGSCYKKINLTGANFYFSIIPGYKGASIKNLQIKYKILGE